MSGEILIDGIPMQTLNLNWVRNNITLLEQRSALFNDSVFQNIAFGSRDHGNVTLEDVQDSVKLAMLENTIDSLPKGIDTCVGPGGSFLSGGQRQRVAIARAKLRDTPILILDEPTSALDHTNSVAVMKALRVWRAGKTTIIITHDMSHIVDEDHLYVLEKGSIVHSGLRQDVAKLPGSEKYFGSTVKASTVGILPKTFLMDKGLESDESDWDTSSVESLEDLEPPMPQRLYQPRRQSWAQHHIPPSLRSNAWEGPARRVSIRSNPPRESEGVPFPQSKRLSSLGVPKASISHNGPGGDAEIPAEELEMVQLYPTGPRTDRLRSFEKSRHLSVNRASSTMDPPKRRKAKEEKMASLSQIMGTIVPNLTTKQRILLFTGIASALVHASATPVFSYCLSQLFSTFYAGANGAKLTRTWSLAVLGVSFGDGLASFFMHYFLEFCGEAWMDTLRKKAFQRVLDQPRAWFEKDCNSSHRLTSYLDQNGEDMRNLLGRFAGFVIVAAAITVMAIIWSLIVCWKLTLVALSCGPVIYAITRGFEGVNGLWERRCNEVTSMATDIFTETFSEIRTVRVLTLEGYFHPKQELAISRCLTTGLKRAIYTGLLFGMVESTVVFASGKDVLLFGGRYVQLTFIIALIFYYGAVLAASEFTVNDVMQVFSLLLFSIGYAAQILSWSS